MSDLPGQISAITDQPKLSSYGDDDDLHNGQQHEEQQRPGAGLEDLSRTDKVVVQQIPGRTEGCCGCEGN